MTLSYRKLHYLHLDRHWPSKKNSQDLDKWTMEVKKIFRFQGEKEDNLISILGLFFLCHITAKNLDILFAWKNVEKWTLEWSEWWVKMEPGYEKKNMRK